MQLIATIIIATFMQLIDLCELINKQSTQCTHSFFPHFASSPNDQRHPHPHPYLLSPHPAHRPPVVISFSTSLLSCHL